MNGPVMNTNTRMAEPRHGIRCTTSPTPTDLGLAMLIAESEDGRYEPVAIVANVREARGIAQHDYRSRINALSAAALPFCPYLYKVWARGANGEHRIVCEITDVLK